MINAFGIFDWIVILCGFGVLYAIIVKGVREGVEEALRNDRETQKEERRVAEEREDRRVRLGL